MNTLRKLVIGFSERGDKFDRTQDRNSAYENDLAADKLSTITPAWERLLEAAKQMLESCPCQNGCAPDDTTCATNALRKAIQEVQS